VPNLQPTEVLIRTQDSNNALVEDIFASSFSIIAPLLLTSPNGSQVWEGVTSHQINWVNSGTSDYYNLDYSLDVGNTWLSIAQAQLNTSGTFNWAVPSSLSSSALVRVADYNDTCKSDVSDSTFEVSANQ
jgi:hypothetical protein